MKVRECFDNGSSIVQDELGEDYETDRDTLDNVGQKAKSNLAIIDGGRKNTGLVFRGNKQREDDYRNEISG